MPVRTYRLTSLASRSDHPVGAVSAREILASLVFPQAGSDQSNASSSSRKAVIEWVVIAAVVILLGFILWKSSIFRERASAGRSFLLPPLREEWPEHPLTTTELWGYAHLGMPEARLAYPTAAYMPPESRTHGLEIGPGGRRLGLEGRYSRGKDALPAYDGRNRPPAYERTAPMQVE
ncbi:unnamed protein product [Mycena citricolor]|uniref:Uncharacterized protein n=1 Tax=Mycena citricolor TaxID=2018698 RepID=A0AAD2Q3E7_9AGAR|nr:unnamed protein product [Mycena citricolor]